MGTPCRKVSPSPEGSERVPGTRRCVTKPIIAGRTITGPMPK